ncbi:hypothetical protein PN480_18980 [Dolichospermum circinale CS-1225]|uniref:hypothetical protein n=1 Tax=Dolichospermum circinale TaxID=109265 RepID=UPI0012DD0294|nr:hypothetical protein [Dolichospermum circinale]MDB9524012.1 hypothetical protein [Dolichospermum circinale CS-1225]
MTREQGTGNREQGTGNKECYSELVELLSASQGRGNRLRSELQPNGFRQLYFSLLMSVFFRLPTYLGFFGLST